MCEHEQLFHEGLIVQRLQIRAGSLTPELRTVSDTHTRTPCQVRARQKWLPSVPRIVLSLIKCPARSKVKLSRGVTSRDVQNELAAAAKTNRCGADDADAARRSAVARDLPPRPLGAGGESWPRSCTHSGAFSQERAAVEQLCGPALHKRSHSITLASQKRLSTPQLTS